MRTNTTMAAARLDRDQSVKLSKIAPHLARGRIGRDRAVLFHKGGAKRREMRTTLTIVAAAALMQVVPAYAGMQALTHDVRFCPTWAEAHERTLASLNNGRPPYPVKWQGCIALKRGTKVDVIDADPQVTEIVYAGKHWFADELP
jgi:hypothetical protein